MKIAYCDTFSGISGDMFLGALLDAGLPMPVLEESLRSLALPEPYRLELKETHKGALRASLFTVHLPHEHDGHAHEHEHSHGHRHLADITALIENSGLAEPVKRMSLGIFQTLAQAEARVHGTPIEAVHFHEVGATDSIIDIIGAAVGLDYLGIEQLYASPLPMGSGQVETQHGLLPLPAPATLELLRLAQAPTVPSQARVELVTPTGAAILGTLATFQQPSMRVTQVGIGAGQRDLPWPNVLRLIVGESEAEAPGQHVLLETNIDDMNPQLYAQVMGELFKAGALDVFLTPIQMKKNRPATMLSVIAQRKDEAALARRMLEETSTLGVRVQKLQRYEAERTFQTVATEFGPVQIKLKQIDGAVVQAAPEYDSCLQIAQEQNIPLAQVYTAAVAAAHHLVQAKEK